MENKTIENWHKRKNICEDDPLMKKPKANLVMTYLSSRARFQSGEKSGLMLEKGQVVIGLASLSIKLNLSRESVRQALIFLEKHNHITTHLISKKGRTINVLFMQKNENKKDPDKTPNNTKQRSIKYIKSYSIHTKRKANSSFSKLKFKEGSAFKDLDTQQTGSRIRRYGLDRVQEWISKLEVRGYGYDKAIANPNALLHKALQDGAWWEKQKWQIEQSNKILEEHEARKQQERQEFVDLSSYQSNKILEEQEVKNDETIYRNALLDESVVINATELLKMELSPQHPMFKIRLKYRIINMYKQKPELCEAYE